jgi:hypothetical protein
MSDPASPAAPGTPAPPPDAPARRKPGRKSKWTPEAREAILTALRIGCPRGTACESAGISRTVFAEWMTKGEAATAGEFRQFFEDVRTAEADATKTYAALVLKAANAGDAKSAQWWLARRHPKEFGERTQIELKVAGEREAMLDAAKRILPDEQYRALLTELASRDVGDDDA